MRPAKSKSRYVAAALLMALVVFGTACAPFWRQVREWERNSAAASADSYAKRGNCARTLKSLDHAEAGLAIGSYAKAATRMRMICYERMGRTEVARAHQRMLDDFYEGENPAYPTGLGDDLFRVKTVPKDPFKPPPALFKIMPPIYNDHAKRSHIVGRVVVSFKLTSKDAATRIRVLEMPHPLLGTWAIEALERSRRNNLDQTTLIPPGEHYVTTFNFYYHHAQDGPTVDE